MGRGRKIWSVCVYMPFKEWGQERDTYTYTIGVLPEMNALRSLLHVAVLTRVMICVLMAVMWPILPHDDDVAIDVDLHCSTVVTIRSIRPLSFSSYV